MLYKTLYSVAVKQHVKIVEKLFCGQFRSHIVYSKLTFKNCATDIIVVYFSTPASSPRQQIGCSNRISLGYLPINVCQKTEDSLKYTTTVKFASQYEKRKYSGKKSLRRRTREK